jgi:hypothetical protein
VVVDPYTVAGTATRSTVAARALVLSLRRQAAAGHARAGDGVDEMIRVGWRRNPNRGPRYLPPYFPSDVS